MRVRSKKEKYICNCCGKEVALTDKHYCTEITICHKLYIADLCDECYEKVVQPIKASIEAVFKKV